MAARLLIVEDDPALAELLIWHFEAEGYEVRHTADGEEALLLAAEETPDAIILDWMIERKSIPRSMSCSRIKTDICHEVNGRYNRIFGMPPLKICKWNIPSIHHAALCPYCSNFPEISSRAKQKICSEVIFRRER